jgi:hypothetical protein
MANGIDNKAFDMMENASSGEDKHLALAMAGMVPGPTGVAADITDAALYAKEKRWKDMGWSLMGAVPLLGQVVSAKKIAKLTKSIEMTGRIRRMAKYERMTESIDNGSLLFSNSKWQKAIDKGDMWIDEAGDMYGLVGGKGLGAKIGNVYKTPKYERYSDYYKMMNEISDDMEKVVKNMPPEQLAIAKSLGNSPTMRKELKDIVLKLEKLLPKTD